MTVCVVVTQSIQMQLSHATMCAMMKGEAESESEMPRERRGEGRRESEGDEAESGESEYRGDSEENGSEGNSVDVEEWLPKLKHPRLVFTYK